MTRTRFRPAGPERDRGLPAERTRLAWQRTALAAAGYVVVIARLQGSVAATAAVIVLLAPLAAAATARGRALRRDFRRVCGPVVTGTVAVAVVVAAVPPITAFAGR